MRNNLCVTRYDELTVPGGSLGVTRGVVEEDQLLHYIDIYQRAHGCKSVVLLFHFTCARLAEMQAIVSLTEEGCVILKRMDAATAVIRRHSPSLEIHCCVAMMNEDGIRQIYLRELFERNFAELAREPIKVEPVPIGHPVAREELPLEDPQLIRPATRPVQPAPRPGQRPTGRRV